MNHSDLLIEIGIEELPARLVKKLSEDFFNLLLTQLQQAQFIAHGKTQYFATPRRLAFLFENINIQQPEQFIEKRGPAKEAAFDKSGNPTPACMGFAKTNQVAVKDLEFLETDKGIWVVFRGKQPGKNLQELLSEILIQAYKKLPLPKTMRWGNQQIEFIRPIHWLVIMLGTEVLPIEFLHLKASNLTYGHRVHAPRAIQIDYAKNYASLLFENYVIADFKERREKITQQLQELANQIQGKLFEDKELLDEVTALVEWPYALLGKINQEFLELPLEVITTVMRHHQKCFAIFDSQGNILPYFITVANLESHDPQQVILGNERVIQARLKDAMFFYKHDIKHSLSSKITHLHEIELGEKLGTMFDKTERLSMLCERFTQQWLNIYPERNNISQLEAFHCGNIAKADLLTGMVSEFPELQGIIGYYYAKQEGFGESQALAIREQYLPRHSQDELPHSPYGIILALADRCDHLFSYFFINKIPTGDKDPFALRRTALGIVRILIEHQMAFSLNFLLNSTQDIFNQQKDIHANLEEKILEFIIERQRAWYLEQNGKKEIWAAVINNISSEFLPYDSMRRLVAVEHFITLPEASALISANKRVVNLLAEHKPGEIQENLFVEEIEKKLFIEICKNEKEIENFKEDYQKILIILSKLRTDVDLFFEKIMIMVDDINIRQNRLALLAKLNCLFKKVADISYLYGML
jgi:glycyl-tRNA synthetase beta chain